MKVSVLFLCAALLLASQAVPAQAHGGFGGGFGWNQGGWGHSGVYGHGGLGFYGRGWGGGYGPWGYGLYGRMFPFYAMYGMYGSPYYYGGYSTPYIYPTAVPVPVPVAYPQPVYLQPTYAAPVYNSYYSTLSAPASATTRTPASAGTYASPPSYPGFVPRPSTDKGFYP